MRNAIIFERMRFSLLFAVSVLFCQCIAMAQYVGPVHRTLQFRIYGKDAKPVTQKDHKVSARLENADEYDANHWSKHDNQFKTSWDGGVFSATVTEPYPTDRHVVLKIEKDGEVMEVDSRVSIDSVPFEPGVYEIPWKYEELFRLKAQPGASIINQDLLLFEQGSEEYRSWELPVQRVTKCAMAHNLDVRGDDIFAMCNYETDEGKFLLSSKDGGETWSPVPAMEEGKRSVEYAHIPGHMSRVVSFLGSDNGRSGPYKAYSMTLDNKSVLKPEAEVDSMLTRMGAYTMHFINEQIGFALGSQGGGEHQFYRTLDGGETWQLHYSGITGRSMRVLWFRDSLHGYIMETHRYQPATYYYTYNGGKHWKEHHWEDMKERALNTKIDSLVLFHEQHGNLAISKEGDGQLIRITPQVLLHTYHRPPGRQLKTLFFDENNGVIFHGHYLLHTTDGGRHWKYRGIGVSEPSRPAYSSSTYLNCWFLDKDHLFLDNGKELYITTLNGQ